MSALPLPSHNAYILQQLSFLLERQSDQVLQEQFGIGYSQFKILKMVQMNPKVQQRQLADNLNQTEASVSRQIKLLRLKGAVVTRVNPESKRERLTILTIKGVRLTEAAAAILDRYFATSFANLDPKQQQALGELLEHTFHGLSPVIPSAKHMHLWENVI